MLRHALCIVVIVAGHHGDLPHGQARAFDVGMAPRHRIAKIDLRVLRHTQCLLDQKDHRLTGPLAQAATQAAEALHLAITQADTHDLRHRFRPSTATIALITL